MVKLPADVSIRREHCVTLFDLVLQTRGSLHPDGEPDRFISGYLGFVHGQGEDGTARRVGKVHAYRIHADLAARHGEPLSDVCDAHSHALHACHRLFYEPDGYHFRDRFGAVECDCLVVDYVVLHPRWRGLRLGLLAVRKLLDLLGGGCGLAVAEVLPLNPQARDLLQVPAAWLPRHPTREAYREAVLKLRRYFRRLGFERVGRTGYYALPLARQTPTLADLLRPSRA
jgi:hypothetical protein